MKIADALFSNRKLLAGASAGQEGRHLKFCKVEGKVNKEKNTEKIPCFKKLDDFDDAETVI